MNRGPYDYPLATDDEVFDGYEEDRPAKTEE
jgi:hypothetical protein